MVMASGGGGKEVELMIAVREVSKSIKTVSGKAVEV